MNDLRIELYKEIQTHENKYTYFILAVAGSAIAFSIQQVHDRSFSFALIPLAISILFWGSSFYYGCKNLQNVRINLINEYELNRIYSGEFDNFPNQLRPDDPIFIDAASKVLKIAMTEIGDKIFRFSQRQFYLLISGAISYVIWNVIEMWIRTQCVK